MKSAEDAGQWLIDDSSQSPDVVRDVHEKLASVSTQLEVLKAGVNDREVRLKYALMQTEEFDDVLKEFEDRMKGISDATAKGENQLSQLSHTRRLSSN